MNMNDSGHSVLRLFHLLSPRLDFLADIVNICKSSIHQKWFDEIRSEKKSKEKGER